MLLALCSLPTVRHLCCSVAREYPQTCKWWGRESLKHSGKGLRVRDMRQGTPMFLSLPGSTDAHTIKVNEEKRLIVGLEGTMKLLAKEIGKEVPGVVSVRVGCLP
jgi:hypothetical protein